MITLLAYSVLLLILHVLVQATFSDLSKGLGWALGPQDDDRPQNQVAGRIERSLSNYLETYPAFVALALMAHVTETDASFGAALYLLARLVYIPAYASGIPLVRSIVWFASVGGLILMLLPFLF